MMLILIAPHEFGHFIVAKLVGVKVNEFSIGMGPLLWQRQKGETKYSIRLIPIGGYNAMEGEDEDSEDPRGFNNQPPLPRIAILLAGVTMNVLIAIIVCIIIMQIVGMPINTIDTVQKGTPAAIAGLQSGDKIVAVNGTETASWEEVTSAIDNYDPGKDGDISIGVKRGGKQETFDLVPEYNKDIERYAIGITCKVSHNPIRCFGSGCAMAWNINKLMFESFKMLIQGDVGADDVSGPVGLVKIVDQTSSQGIENYLLLLALVSLNLALINMLPIPALDGGKIIFVLLKVISRGRISDETEYRATILGFVLLMFLFAVITLNDIKNIF